MRDFVAGVSPLGGPPRDDVPRFPPPRRHVGLSLARRPASLAMTRQWRPPTLDILSRAVATGRPQRRHRAVKLLFRRWFCHSTNEELDMRTLIAIALIASFLYLADGARDFMSATRIAHADRVEAALRQ